MSNPRQSQTAAFPSPRKLGAAISLILLGACNSQAPQHSGAPAEQDVAAAPQPVVADEAAETKELSYYEDIRPEIAKMASEAEALGSANDAAQVRTRVARPLMSHKIAPQIVAAPAHQQLDLERYAPIDDLGLMLTAQSPVSTFSVDVDTGAYANVRRFLSDGALPPKDAVRVEELINYFDYDYPQPADSRPFSVHTELAATPWNPDTLLMQIGIQGQSIPADERPASNLVFLIDVSGSMNNPDKLPLLKDAFSLLTNNLNDHDRVSMVVYAGASGVVLPPTAGDDGQRILDALNRLQAGGSTNGSSGLKLAYEMARKGYIEGGINRIMLATDGDFNVGIADVEKVIDMVERERASGVSLTTLGFGSGNYNDHLMERIADAGDGNYAYIDSVAEARKVLVDQIGSTLHTIAKDVKIQVEFNPEHVSEYRLIGYQNRMLKREDFNNDKVDAGDIGAGHTVTALYELTPVGSAAELVDPLRYGAKASSRTDASDELAFVRLRYKAPHGEVSKLIEQAVAQKHIVPPRDTSDDYRFAAAVAAFGQHLRGDALIGDYSLNETRKLAQGANGADRAGYRRDFLALVDRAQALGEGRPTDADGIAHTR